MSTSRLPDDHHATIFSLETGAALLGRICDHLGVEPGRLEELEFEDGEDKIRPLESVRGRDVFVVQSLHGDDALTVNDKLMRVLFLLAAARDAGARRLTLVAPYLCYSRGDRRTNPRDPVTTRYVATLLEAVGVHRVLTIDVHNLSAYENAFRIPTEHLTAAPAFVEALTPAIGEQEVVVVSPDIGGVKRAEQVRKALEARLGRPVGSAFIEKFRSGGVVRGGTVVGEVKDRIVLLPDDLISSGTTLVRAASSCRAAGASKVYASATHGVFSAAASQTLAASELEQIFILDTIPPHRVDPQLLQSGRVRSIDCAPLLAEAIRRLHTDGSLVELGSEF